MNNTKSGFWVFGSAGPPYGKKEVPPWGVSLAIDAQMECDICSRPGALDLLPLVGEADRPDRVKDVAFVYNGVSLRVVSDRVRRIFEEAGSGDCQFISVDIRHRGESLGLNYWVMHVLNNIECADPLRSRNAPHDDGTPHYFRAAIIAERVPPHISTFRINHGTWSPVIRDALRRALQRSKVSGALYYPP